uniref:Uncharacterized protein n=1 Tax=Setaria italica TaxID=4555 RepID=K3ZKS3_SETIT
MDKLTSTSLVTLNSKYTGIGIYPKFRHCTYGYVADATVRLYATVLLRLQASNATGMAFHHEVAGNITRKMNKL